jgi:hypothetical protein
VHAHGFRSGGPARDQYRRALRQVARDQAVAEAELQVGAAWLAELGRMRAIAERGLMAALAAFREAETPLRAALVAGDAQALADAQIRLQEAYAQIKHKAEVSHTTLRLIAQEIDALARAQQEQRRIGRENMARLWAARRKAVEAGEAAHAAETSELREG